MLCLKTFYDSVERSLKFLRVIKYFTFTVFILNEKEFLIIIVILICTKPVRHKGNTKFLVGKAPDKG